LYLDFLRNPDKKEFESVDHSLLLIPGPMTYNSKEIEKTFMKLSSEIYKQKVEPTTQCMKRLGNMYKASLYEGLAYFIDSEGSKDGLGGKRIGMFSYKSGLAPSFFEIEVKGS
ncbi:hydroxymethylglutaryl-coenzyme A synthase C-terminal domain-containing protein, partial [Phakopsora pachyrhizi]